MRLNSYNLRNVKCLMQEIVRKFIFRKFVSINFYVCILQRIAVLIMNNVLHVYQNTESGDVAQIVSRPKLSLLIG